MRFGQMILLALLVEQAHACPICLPLPKQTIADRLIEADVVAFGREDPEQPFSFVVSRVLKGRVAEPQVGLFADSATRRQLSADKTRFVVLVKSTEGWRNLGVADNELQAIVERILAFAPEWSGADGPQQRLEYFLTLWNHDSRAVCELAYLELGKAPYAEIRRIGAAISSADLQPLLTQRDYYEWRSLAILLSAQQPDETSRRFITSSFENCVRFSLTKDLAAWATAYLEIHRSAGVDWIETQYLGNPVRSETELRHVLAALSVQGHQDDADLRACIVASYRTALKVHPRLADLIARDLTAWNIPGFSPEFSKILADSNLELNPNIAESLQSYINSQSADARSSPGSH